MEIDEEREGRNMDEKEKEEERKKISTLSLFPGRQRKKKKILEGKGGEEERWSTNIK